MTNHVLVIPTKRSAEGSLPHILIPSLRERLRRGGVGPPLTHTPHRCAELPYRGAIVYCAQNDKPRTCHPIFALSLTRFAFRNPNGITCGYAAFDLLLQNSSITKQKSIGSFIVTLMNSPITKRCFVIPTSSSR